MVGLLKIRLQSLEGLNKNIWRENERILMKLFLLKFNFVDETFIIRDFWKPWKTLTMVE